MIKEKYKKMSAEFRFVTLLCLVFLGCASTENIKEQPGQLMSNPQSEPFFGNAKSTPNTAVENFGSENYRRNSTIPETIAHQSVNPNDNLAHTIKMEDHNSSEDITSRELGMVPYLKPESPVADKIVENYLNSNNKEPGGHCLTVSKARFENAYKAVYGHSFYKDLPERIATPYYTPGEVFDFLYFSASGTHIGWRSLPKEYRGRGNAGAIAYAGMGTLIDSLGIWGGQLHPGAMLQVWRYRSDYELVVNGTSDKDFDPYGHSFIFLGYVRDEKQDIIGIRIADQGFQSYRPLTPNDYEVWWGVNLSI
ncbi:hypothetical protein [Aestuariivivens sediminis]|uniref:hypothetical protein n=1 Tax=Aestuariivivens sediminis TaxID=2913557 RepID=UPI001F58BD96|nr:hypothetical protein [Aestuariivivens sediminis]